MGIKKKFGKSRFDRYIFAMLIAVELLMSFTFLGYIQIPPISVTISYIPVILAGYMLGTVQATVVGAVFGFASMYKASAFYVMAADGLFSPLLSGTPVSSFVLSVVTRTLFGFLTGVLFTAAKKSNRPKLWCMVVSAFAYKIHAFLVFTVMGIFFPFMGYSYLTTLNFKWYDLLFIVIDIAAVRLLWKICYGEGTKQLREYIDRSPLKSSSSKKTPRVFFILEALSVGISVLTMLYFVKRAFFMLDRYGVSMSYQMRWDIRHLQGEFLIAFLSLNILAMLVLLLTYKYMAYREYRSEMDSLTGIMGRKIFQHYCDEALHGGADGSVSDGWFILLDVDRFKYINDTYGHSVGDKVLKGIGQLLMDLFYEYGMAGRIGGDEFSVIIVKPVQRNELEQLLDEFLERASCILEESKISCSIGAHSFIVPKNMSNLFIETDKSLYRAKKNGRACYVIENDISHMSDICEE